MRVSADGSGCLCDRWIRGPRAIGRDHRRSKPPVEARVARPDRAAFRRPAAGFGGGSPRRREPAGGLALAAALRRGRCRGAPARQHEAARHASCADRHRRQGSGPYLRRTSGRDHPLDRPGHGESRRPVAAHHPAHLGGSSSPASPRPHLQTLHGPGLRREGRGYRGTLHAPAGPRRGAVDRREAPDPGARPHPAGPAAQARQVRDHDPRLQAPRHDHALRCLQRPGRRRARPLHAESTPIRSSSASSTPSSARSRSASWFTPSSTTTARTSTPRFEPGSPAIHAGCSTSRRPLARGSTPPRTSFSALTRKRLRRGVFRSIVDLQAAINRYLKEHNLDPKPFVWTKPATAILAKLSQTPVPSV